MSQYYDSNTQLEYHNTRLQIANIVSAGFFHYGGEVDSDIQNYNYKERGLFFKTPPDTLFALHLSLNFTNILGRNISIILNNYDFFLCINGKENLKDSHVASIFYDNSRNSFRITSLKLKSNESKLVNLEFIHLPLSFLTDNPKPRFSFGIGLPDGKNNKFVRLDKINIGPLPTLKF